MRVVLATLRERTDANAQTIGALYGRDWLETPQESLEHAFHELVDADVVFVPEPGVDPQPAAYAGLAAVMQLLTAAREQWRSCRYVAEQVEQRAGDVLVSGRVVAELRDSGSRASFPFAHVWTTRVGRAVRIAAYEGLAEARAALAHPDAA